MADLANNLLTLARLDSRSSHQEHEVVRVASLAEAGARRVQALAGQTKISMEVDALPHENLPLSASSISFPPTLN